MSVARSVWIWSRSLGCSLVSSDSRSRIYWWRCCEQDFRGCFLYFSSWVLPETYCFHRSIARSRPQSIYFSVSAVAVGLWIDYFRAGRLRFLIFSGLALGLLVGLRPAGLGLLPMHAFAGWMKRLRNFPAWMLAAAVVLPVAIGAGSERLLYRAVHGGMSKSTAHNLAMGIAAMLIKPDMTFTGPHAAALNILWRAALRQVRTGSSLS